jgi:hypothetical protein
VFLLATFQPRTFQLRTFQPWTFQPHGSKSWLKSLGLRGPGLKLGVEKSGVEMSFNHLCYWSFLHFLLHIWVFFILFKLSTMYADVDAPFPQLQKKKKNQDWVFQSDYNARNHVVLWPQEQKFFVFQTLCPPVTLRYDVLPECCFINGKNDKTSQ